MSKKLPQTKLDELNVRFAEAKDKITNLVDPLGIIPLVDKMSADDPDIASLMEKIMAKMNAEGGAGKYDTTAGGGTKLAKAMQLIAEYNADKKAAQHTDFDHVKGGTVQASDEQLRETDKDVTYNVDHISQNNIIRNENESTDKRQEGEVPENERTAKLELWLLEKKVANKREELETLSRVAELVNAPAEEKAQKIALMSQLAELMTSEAGGKPPWLNKSNIDPNTGENKDEQPGATGKYSDESMQKDDKEEGKFNQSSVKSKRDHKAALEEAARTILAAIDEEEAEKAPVTASAELTTAQKAALLKTRLASLRKTAKPLDNRTMETPDEVPKPDGTVEDDYGTHDAPIQYQSAHPLSNNLEQIVTKKQKLPDDGQRYTDDKGNPKPIFQGNTPGSQGTIQTAKDADGNDGQKRIIPDGGYGTQPSGGDGKQYNSVDRIDVGNKGTHQEAIDWEKAKDDADMTALPDRVRSGIAELIKQRTDRATKLANKMVLAGQIKNQNLLMDQITKLAAMEDSEFHAVANFFGSTNDEAEAVDQDETPAPRTAKKRPTTTPRQKVEAALEEDDDAIEAEAELEEDAPKPGLNRLEGDTGKRVASQLGIREAGFLSGFGSTATGHRGPSRPLRDTRLAALFDIGWESPETIANKLNAEAFLGLNGNLDAPYRGGSNPFEAKPAQFGPPRI